MVAFWITLPDFDKSLVYCAVYGSKIAFCCIYSQHNCIYTQGRNESVNGQQQEVFDLIRDHISQTGMPPTRAEIAQRLGFRSPNAAEEHLKALARKGVIEIVSGASRGIRLLQEEEEGLPLVGRVAAVNRFWRNSILKVIIRSILPCSSRMLISCCASAGCR